MPDRQAMNVSALPQRKPTPKNLWYETPVAWKVAIVLATTGWSLHVGGYRSTVSNGVVESCQGFDAGPFIAGGLVLVAVMLGALRINRHPRQHLLSSAMYLAIGCVIAAGGLALLLRGTLDPDGTMC